MAEVHEFSESTKSKIERGMKGQELVNEVVMEWESVVNRVAKCEIGEKMIVCGRAARWWDEQIKDKINARRQVYKKVVNGREDLWGEYCRLRKEVKQLVIEKKLNIWNELVEKVNTDFDENRKEFWAFVGRKSKGKKKYRNSLNFRCKNIFVCRNRNYLTRNFCYNEYFPDEYLEQSMCAYAVHAVFVVLWILEGYGWTNVYPSVLKADRRCT